MSDDFEIWWHNNGSGMPPFKEEETCEHVKRVSAIAWSNGAFKATLSIEAENARLKAEVERLRKAGDAMAEGLLKYIEPTDGYLTYLECRANWNASKREQGCLVNPSKVAQYLPKPPAAKEGKPGV